MQLGMIGLGRMGANMVRRLMRGGHDCVVYDRSPQAVAGAGEGRRHAAPRRSPSSSRSSSKPRARLPDGAGRRSSTPSIDELAPLLETGDAIIDGGNSHYHDDIARAKRLAAAGMHYVDMGTSGGVWGLERGYCLMIGGEREVVQRLDPIFATLAPGRGDIPRTAGPRDAAAAPPSTATCTAAPPAPATS